MNSNIHIYINTCFYMCKYYKQIDVKKPSEKHRGFKTTTKLNMKKLKSP